MLIGPAGRFIHVHPYFAQRRTRKAARQYPAVKRHLKKALKETAARDQTVDINAGPYAHFLEDVDQVLSGQPVRLDPARGLPLDELSQVAVNACPTETRLESAYAAFQGGHDIRQCQPPVFIEMHCQLRD